MTPDEIITVSVPLDVEETVYIFTGTADDVDERIDHWLSTGQATWNETRPMSGEDFEAVDSYVMPETQPDTRDTEVYQKALLAQLDYDSTRTGRDELRGQIDQATDAVTLRALHARVIAGEAAALFRSEMLAIMPAAPERGTEMWSEVHRPLARARERLAQRLALATAETRAFARPSPQTLESIYRCVEEIRPLAERFGQAWWGPVTAEGVAQWLRAPTRPVGARDVPVLWALRVEARWDGQQVIAHSDLDAAWRVGYRTGTPGESPTVVMAVPNVLEWAK